MRTFAICGLVWVGLAGGLAVGQGPGPATTVTMPATPLLPANDRLVAPDEARPVPADSAEVESILKEDGFKAGLGRVVMTPVAKAAAGAAAGWVKAYEFGDATGAYSAYTALSAGGRATPSPGRVNASEVVLPGGEVVFQSGVSVVRAQIKLYPEAADALLKTVDVALPKVSGSKGVAPLLPTFVPKAGLEAGSVRYAVGPVGYQAMGGVLPAGILGWDKSAEVATASYKGKGTLTLLLYPTPQIAGDRGRALQDEVNKEGVAKFGTVSMRRIGPLVAVTTGGWTEEQAKAMVGSVHLNEEVTFDKKMPLEFHAEIRKTASLLENIAIFSGVLILAAILLGLFLGGARAGIRKMQGKPAYVEPEFLTITLRESETEHFKKIHSEVGKE